MKKANNLHKWIGSLFWKMPHKKTPLKRHRNRHKHTQKHTQTHRPTHTHRHTDTKTNRQTDTETHRHIDTHHIHTHGSLLMDVKMEKVYIKDYFHAVAAFSQD